MLSCFICCILVRYHPRSISPVCPMCFKHLVHTFFLQLRRADSTQICRASLRPRATANLPRTPMLSLNPARRRRTQDRASPTATAVAGSRRRGPRATRPAPPSGSRCGSGSAPGSEVDLRHCPLILQGIRERARVGDPRAPRDRTHQDHGAPRWRRPIPSGAGRRTWAESGAASRHGAILVYPFAESAALEVTRGRTSAVSVLECDSALGIDLVDTDDDEAVAALVGRLHRRRPHPDRIPGVGLSRRQPSGGSAGSPATAGAGAPADSRPDRDWVLNVRGGEPRA